MIHQILALWLTGAMALSQGATAIPIGEPASLQKAAVAEATLCAYPRYVDWNNYQVDATKEKLSQAELERLQRERWDQYEKDRAAYEAQAAAIRTGEISPAFQNAVGKFSQKTLGRLLEKEGNSLYAPVNLYVALSVLASCTGGETQDQVLSLLGAGDEKTLRTQCRNLWTGLYLDDGIGKRLLANSLWLREGFPFHEDLMQTLVQSYYASAYQVQMGPQADRAMQDWVNRQTGNLLAQQAKGIQTNPDETALVLLSTLHFYDQWKAPFRASATGPDAFVKADGSRVTCDFMHGSWTGQFLQTRDYLAASREFERGGGMLFLLPGEGKRLSDLTRSGALTSLFDGTVYQSADSRVGHITLSVPKFDLTSSLDWKKDLQALGVQKAFDENAADFTPLTGEPWMYLDKIQQATRVTIDERGCTAASYVEMQIGAGSALVTETCELKLDRPFLFVIFSQENIPLLIGGVEDPTA